MVDAWEFEPASSGDDDEEEAGDAEADEVHPQASLLPAPDEDSFPSSEDLADLKWLPASRLVTSLRSD